MWTTVVALLNLRVPAARRPLRTRVQRVGRLNGALTGSAMLIIAVVTAALGAGSTYAFLNASASANAATSVSAGSAGFSVATVTALSTTGVYPGSGYSYGAYTLTNEGQVPLAISVASVSTIDSDGGTNLGASLTVDAVLVPVTTDCSAATYDQYTRGGPTNLSAAAGLAAPNRFIASPTKPTTRLCVRVSLPTSAPAAAAARTTNVAITLGGVQQ